ncbi:MAG: HypC/HybG/HupF family hydrogenase formation chaperone [Actinomycetota bacterium]
MCLGVPGKLTEIRDDRGTRMATVDFGGVTKEICLAYVPQAQVGDYTIIHAGFAITLLDEASALETLSMMKDVGLLDDELGLDDSMMAAVETGRTEGPADDDERATP